MAALVTTVVGPGAADPARIERLTLLLSATIQGVSAAVASGRVSPAQGEMLLDDAISVFIAGAAGVSA